MTPRAKTAITIMATGTVVSLALMAALPPAMFWVLHRWSEGAGW